jgi:hypothetical protein
MIERLCVQTLALVNGNYRLRYRYRYRFRQFSDILVPAEISDKVGTEISAIKNSFLKGRNEDKKIYYFAF